MEEDKGRFNIQDEAVVSFNQQGGQTARNITNIGLQPRTFKNTNIQYIIDGISGHSGTEVNIDSIMGDAESVRFASELKELLEKAGWKVNGVNQVALVGDLPIGIVLRSTAEHPQSFKDLGQRLVKAGFKAKGIYDDKGVKVLTVLVASQ